jgi:hypothetical protein
MNGLGASLKEMANGNVVLVVDEVKDMIVV